MSVWQQYILAKSIDDALTALASADSPSLPVGGGTDLILEIQQGRHPPVHTLVDVTSIPELNRLEIDRQQLFIGAGISIRKIVESALVRKHAIALSEACDLIGGPQVRNTATLGGNVAHALPAADGMIALLALDARAEIASASGRRELPLAALFAGPGQSILQKDKEILVGFYLPVRQACQGSAFSRVMRPQGVALPIINMAVWLERDDEVISDIRIAIGPSGPLPIRAIAAEETLRGKKLSSASISTALESIHQTIPFRSSVKRGSAAYRHHLSDVLLEEVMTKAYQRASRRED